jgi:DNA-binding GntR family transcriptional regulator
VYRVQWKKPSIDQDELAKLYWDEGLTVADIATRFGAGKTTVRDHLYRLKALRLK